MEPALDPDDEANIEYIENKRESVVLWRGQVSSLSSLLSLNGFPVVLAVKVVDCLSKVESEGNAPIN